VRSIQFALQCVAGCGAVLQYALQCVLECGYERVAGVQYPMCVTVRCSVCCSAVTRVYCNAVFSTISPQRLPKNLRSYI